MKKITSVLVLMAFVLLTHAQPAAFSYQAIARDKIGQPLGNKNIGVRFSILNGSVSGNAVYVETHSTSTNAFGLFFLSVGKGNGSSGAFADIDWANGEKFLKVEIDAGGGSNYQLQNTTQLLSVPYALYAEKTKLNAGNAISITNGNTISANYLGGTGIAVLGNTISHNLVGGNAISITGNSIAANYQAGTGIAIAGNTISGNYKAGTGIAINNGTISSTGSDSYWLQGTGGIYYPDYVAVGRTSIDQTANASALDVYKEKTSTVGGPTARFGSNDTWQTKVDIYNSSNTKGYQLVVGGSGNPYYPGSFGIINGFRLPGVLSFPIICDPDDNVGIGMIVTNSDPKARLHVRDGDVYLDQVGKGVIMKSPDGKCWRVTVANDGSFVSTSIPCP